MGSSQDIFSSVAWGQKRKRPWDPGHLWALQPAPVPGDRSQHSLPALKAPGVCGGFLHTLRGGKRRSSHEALGTGNRQVDIESWVSSKWGVCPERQRIQNALCLHSGPTPGLSPGPIGLGACSWAIISPLCLCFLIHKMGIITPPP